VEIQEVTPKRKEGTKEVTSEEDAEEVNEETTA